MTIACLHIPGEWYDEIIIPASWNECTRAELMLTAAHILMPATSEADPHRHKVELFFALINQRAKSAGRPMPAHWELRINIDDLATGGMDALAWVKEPAQLTNQPFAILETGGLTLNSRLTEDYGEFKSFGSDITAGEFEDAEALYYQFVHNGFKVEDLARMVAVLWRPEGEAYDPNKLEARTQALRQADPVALFLCQMWFNGCRHVLPRLFPTIFEKTGDNDSPDPMAFTKCIHAGAGPKYGTISQVRNLPLIEFMFGLELEALQVKKMETA